MCQLFLSHIFEILLRDEPYGEKRSATAEFAARLARPDLEWARIRAPVPNDACIADPEDLAQFSAQDRVEFVEPLFGFCSQVEDSYQ